jgi:LEA14-like dessication related protein
MRSLIFAAALTLAACSRPEPPTLTPERATVTAVTPAGLDLQVRFDAHNPNGFEIAARSVKADVKLDGKFDVGTVTVPVALRLPPRKHTPLEVPLSVKWRDVAGLALLAAGRRGIPYEVAGTVAIGGEKLNVDVPFRLTGTITQEQLIQALGNSLPMIPGLR